MEKPQTFPFGIATFYCISPTRDSFTGHDNLVKLKLTCIFKLSESCFSADPVQVTPPPLSHDIYHQAQRKGLISENFSYW